ncbi:MAG: ATP-binding protein [Acidimicrobiaceae bacterium]|nr:ATP-binding protein [Acidimicrobiaceae bacterium]
MPAPRGRAGWPAWLHWPRRSARFRLTAVYGGFFALSGVALVAITYVLFERATAYKKPHLPQVPHTPAIGNLAPLTEARQQLMQAQHQLAQALLPRAVYGGPIAQAQNFLSKAQHQLAVAPGPGVPTVLGQVRQVLARDQHELAQAQQKLTRAASPLGAVQHQLAQGQHQLAQASQQLAQAVHQIAQNGSIQAAQRASDSHQLLVNSGIALAVVTVVALLAGWLVAGRMLRPIRTITRTAKRISSSNLNERLALGGPPDELTELADTLDDLFGRLDAAFEAQRHFVANASHELRTPLTAERSLLQVALDDPDTDAETWRCTAEEVLASNDEQKHLIEALLALASSEGGLDSRERTDLAELCRTVLPRPALDAETLALQVETDLRPAPVEGDPRLIERLVANLVDNAIGHNVAGGCVRISTDAADGRAMLTVVNTGPVIPPGELERLFQPFQRLDPRRTHHKNGHGLGLSIVRAIAGTHHATVTAEAPPEGGLSLRVAFPPPPAAGTSPRKAARNPQMASSPA